VVGQRRSRKAPPRAPPAGYVAGLQRAAITQAAERVTADVEHLAYAAQEGAFRMRRATSMLLAELDRGRLVDAAHVAGQIAMLSRMVEIRLLSAIERRAGARTMTEAAAAVFSEP
jgi:hypothetical protein